MGAVCFGWSFDGGIWLQNFILKMTLKNNKAKPENNNWDDVLNGEKFLTDKDTIKIKRAIKYFRKN